MTCMAKFYVSRLWNYIRPEMKFDGFEAIKAQIAADCVTAREILDAATCDDITTPRQIAEAGNER